jgi:hypothetical protein
MLNLFNLKKGVTFSFALALVILFTSLQSSTGSVTGSWSESASRLVINFGTDPLLGKLNDDFLKEEKTIASIKLSDDNPLKNEKLQFAKN